MFANLPQDPAFYAIAIPAVILIGLSKGGLGGAMALLGVPLLALAVPPVQAAAILLPILILMDIVSLWTWRGNNDPGTLRIMVPGALIGIAIGWLTAAVVTDGLIRLIVGLVALAFFLDYVRSQWTARRDRIGQVPQGRPHDRVRGSFWGAVSGFTSFVAHAGGPPYQVYTLPLRQPPPIYTGTSVRFFAIMNAVKVLPYFMLGQFDAENLAASAVLMPFAPLATLAGAWLVRRMNARIFYPVMYGMVFVAALKLIYDGFAAFTG
jgi:uncharacterized membrane protein YfcA